MSMNETGDVIDKVKPSIATTLAQLAEKQTEDDRS